MRGAGLAPLPDVLRRPSMMRAGACRSFVDAYNRKDRCQHLDRRAPVGSRKRFHARAARGEVVAVVPPAGWRGVVGSAPLSDLDGLALK